MENDKLKEIQNYDLGFESYDKAKKSDNLETSIAKKNFIKKLKAGLGDKIKENPSKVEIREIPWYTKVMVKIKAIYWMVRIMLWQRK